MIWQETPYTMPLVIASGASIVLGVYLGFRHRNLGDIIGMILILTNTECMLTYALELASADLNAKIFWNNMQFAGLVVIPTAWLACTLWYTGRTQVLTRRILAGLTVVPTATLVLTFTNRAHGLMHSRATLYAGPFLLLEKTYGAWFWFYMAYSYVLILIGIFLLIRMVILSRYLYRWQTTALLFGAFIPWMAATVVVFDVGSFTNLNLIPFAFAVSNVTVAFSISYLRLGEIVPLAREMIIERMEDSVMVLDTENRIVDVNPSAQYLIGGAFIGESVDDVLPEWSSQIESGGTEEKEIILDRKNVKHTYDVSISPLVDWRGYTVSRVVVLRDITDRKQAEERIKQSLQEKEVLLREIHHRVKNNIQVISSLLNLQSHYIKDKKYIEMLKESQDRIKSMALVHEKLYQSENLADINFGEYVKTLVESLFRSYGVSASRIRLHIEVDNIPLDIDTAIPCGLIINELVSNALKHAFPGNKKGEIMITLHSSNSNITLVISDTGTGIPDTVDFTHTESLGLRLVTILAEDQLNGEISLDRSKGTTFRISFKK